MATAGTTRTGFSRADLDALVGLLEVPSVVPLEGGEPAAATAVQDLLVAEARRRGYSVLVHGPPPPAVLDSPLVPRAVLDAAAADPRFLEAQPSAVLALGSDRGARRRLCVTFHVDTVAPHVPPRLDGGVLHGRGAIDNKGPGFAALVGAARAFEERPELADEIEVRIASVPGEEGGAMGSYGARWLMDEGHAGRLTLFAEPTGGAVVDLCTASMTLLVEARGEDSTDDLPFDGHNATIALGFVARELARELGAAAAEADVKPTIAGLHTGPSHNRVYGSGRLLVNIAYFDAESAAAVAERADRCVAAAGQRFAEELGRNPLARRVAEDWDSVVRSTWLKRGLPTLRNRDPDMESLLAAAGFERPEDQRERALTCDAIWAGAPGRYVAVCGPGDLGANGAHTDGEHVALAELEDYAERVRRLVIAFGERAAKEEG